VNECGNKTLRPRDVKTELSTTYDVMHFIDRPTACGLPTAYRNRKATMTSRCPAFRVFDWFNSRKTLRHWAIFSESASSWANSV